MNKSLLGILTACIAAAGAGYWIARQSPVRTAAEDGISSGLVETAAQHAVRPDERTSDTSVKSRNPAQLLALKEDLRNRLRNCPSPRHDWGWREQTAAILATMDPQELEAFAREYLPANPSPKLRPGLIYYNPLCREILRQWGLKDPAGACLSLAGTHRGTMAEIYGQWRRRDAAAAQAWLETIRFQQDDDKIKALVRENFLSQQVADDFAAARASLEAMEPDAQKQKLEEWSRLVAHDPGKRAELLSLLANRGDAELADKCYQKLISEMADKSPNEAANFIESTNLDEEQKNKLNDQVIGKWALKDPVRAFAKWEELARDDAPAELLPAISQWSLNSPGAEQAQEWVKKLPPGPASDKFKLELIKTWSGHRLEQIADVSATLNNPTERIRQMKRLKRTWDSYSPDGAKKWVETLPQVDRDALEKSLE